MDFREQVVLVTGAGRGIGQAIAQVFAEEGSKVIVNDVHGENASRTAQAISDSGGQALAIQADIANREAVNAMFEQAQAHFGAVTTLINNAGVVLYKPVMEFTSDLWDTTMNIDLKGIFYCTQAAVPQMVSRGEGYIVSIASVHASRTLPKASAYAAAKGGVVSLTHNLAFELGQQNIRVNCVSPGAIDTDALQAYFDALPEDKREAERNYMMSWHPLGRFGQPRDIANVVAFLCSDKAAFIHGTEIVVDGGLLARLF
jgi:NAD(P)-dependent dehydrogenase (short-subunit alcohol dehydrogenase family)